MRIAWHDRVSVSLRLFDQCELEICELFTEVINRVADIEFEIDGDLIIT